MKTTLTWEGNSLVLTTAKKRRVLAEYLGPNPPFRCTHLRTWWGNFDGGYFIGMGKSLMLGVESESYWSRVQGQTYAVHFDAATGNTAVRSENSRNYKFLQCGRVTGGKV